MLEKVVHKLSNEAKPKTLDKLRKDITNQINNMKSKNSTSDLEKEIIVQDKDMNNRIISILEALNLIGIDKTIENCPIKYPASIIGKYNDLKKYQDIENIIESRCN